MDATSSPQQRLTAQAARWGVIVDDVEEYEPGALLLERLSPGESLVTMSRDGDDVRATEVLSTADTQIDRALVVRAGATYASRCDAQLNVRLLHGDLQHDNVLRDDRRGWLAIDPKGVIGEVEYELGAFLRNPGEVPSLFLDAEVTERRAVQLATALDCDATRILQWAFAQAVLSAIWSVEDSEPLASPAPNLLFAETVERIVGRS